MTCPVHGGPRDGPTCWCGMICADDEPRDGFSPTPHSRMNAAQAIHEARRLGEPSEGDGWRRLLFRMAQLLEAKGGHHAD